MAAFNENHDNDAQGGDPPSGKRLTPDQIPYATALVKEHDGPIRRYLRRALRDRQLADDYTQETHLRTIRKIASGEPFPGPPIAYAMTIARNLVIDHSRRKSSKEHPVGEFNELGATWPPRPYDADPTSASTRFVALLGEVKDAIGDDLEFQVWELSVVWDQQGVEIADILKISEAQVSRKLKAARLKAGGITQDSSEGV
ncbi:sigma-70 family RNA polymerase sigma factor [Streptomyces sp. NBC_00075]|uniref:RNA polymerase sigma factor n=1 Tax=Streptomyces sp. NBC_00075 TaxID=2975641 RepID=UPI0032436204